MTADHILLGRIAQINWTDWQPVWTVKNKKKQKPQTPHDFQENHSPSRREKLRHGSRDIGAARRRTLDARLWNSLGPGQQEAAIRIEQACHLVSQGLGFRTSAPHLERISGGTAQNTSEYHDHLTRIYLEWARACQQQKFSHAAGLDILVFGKSCRTVDQARARRKGWARQNLDEILNLYCKMKGWQP